MSRGKHKKDYDEIDHIREDIQSLKTNVIALTQHVKSDGREQFADIEGRMRKSARSMAKAGKQKYAEMEGHVRDNPAQSVLMAFCGGLAASYLLRHRGR